MSQSERLRKENKKTPADAVIVGYGKINGRMACGIAEDFTVLGGSVGRTHWLKNWRTVQLAKSTKVPIVWMMDGAGARAEETINMGLPNVDHFLEIARLSGIVPRWRSPWDPVRGIPPCR